MDFDVHVASHVVSVFNVAFTDENVVEPDIGSQWKEVHVGHTHNEVRGTTEDGTSSSSCLSQDSTHRYCLVLLLQLVTAPYILPRNKIHHLSAHNRQRPFYNEVSLTKVARPKSCTDSSRIFTELQTESSSVPAPKFDVYVLFLKCMMV
ncbi:Ribosomal protein S12 methylthiotransferase [Frankliniella fusca]|uniref:Ribosomal protein S12 methylthiotransferase n=1 Tax=Frankliniella fusca TaxID=407009 RepID=A0AAE1HDU4_9NEOP|nr:Ribosomal protein S12 methylthiotransferase [Frankliniella fusca]